MRYLKIHEEFTNDINNMNDLTAKLNKYNISTEEWGTKKSKSIKYLLNELNEKECVLVEEDGGLVRYIEFVGIKVYYNDEDGNNWYLNEDEQIFTDGRKRRRTMQSSVSEKMIAGEDPKDGAVRGAMEEIGVKLDINKLTSLRDISFNDNSPSYPGLQTKYKGYQFTTVINKYQFNPDGYVEKQEDKSTFFKWVKI